MLVSADSDFLLFYSGYGWFCTLEHILFQFTVYRNFLVLLTATSFCYLYICTCHVKRCFQFLAVINSVVITHTEFHQVQVNRRDKFSWVGGIAEADLSTFVISVNISNHLCLHITESTRFSHQNKFFFSFSQSFGFYTKPLQDTYMLTLESGTYSERQPSDCAQGLARISSAPAQCS